MISTLRPVLAHGYDNTTTIINRSFASFVSSSFLDHNDDKNNNNNNNSDECTKKEEEEEDNVLASLLSSSSWNNNNNQKINRRKLYFKVCYNDFDLEEGDIIQSTMNLHDIHEQAYDVFGSNVDANLQYFDGYDWYPLPQPPPRRRQDNNNDDDSDSDKKKKTDNDDDEKNVEHLLRFVQYVEEIMTSSKSSKSSMYFPPPIPIRIPALYDEDYGTNDDTNDIIKLRKMTPEQMEDQRQATHYRPTVSQLQLKETIVALYKTLHAQGYTTTTQTQSSSSSSEGMKLQRMVIHDSKGTSIPTRDWILQQVTTSSTKSSSSSSSSPSSSSLRSVLLSQPHSIHHIVEALHDYTDLFVPDSVQE